MGLIAVIFHNRCVVVAVGNVLVTVKQCIGRAAEWPVLLTLPIVKLQSIDVATVEHSHFGCYYLRGLVAAV